LAWTQPQKGVRAVMSNNQQSEFGMVQTSEECKGKMQHS
jgi:hypothetical protein